MDFSKAAMLLHVCAKSKDWPNLKVLHDAAMGELEAMCKPPEVQQPKAVLASKPSTADAPRRVIPSSTGDA